MRVAISRNTSGVECGTRENRFDVLVLVYLTPTTKLDDLKPPLNKVETCVGEDTETVWRERNTKVVKRNL